MNSEKWPEVEITLTPGGGRYYQAMVFHWAAVAVFILPVIVLIMLALINPFWFRTAMFEWIERLVNSISRWRNYTKYRIYLGTDPEMWHRLRGDIKE